MKKFSFDPGQDGKTGFYYPHEWNAYMLSWPSTLGYQTDDPYHYCPEFRGKEPVFIQEEEVWVFEDA